MLLIGSRAMIRAFPQAREPHGDWDFIDTAENITRWVTSQKNNIRKYRIKGDHKLFVSLKTGEKLEIEIAKIGSSALYLLNLPHSPSSIRNIGSCRVVSPAFLLMLKKSHIHVPIHWQKNIEDYHFLKARVETVGSNEKMFYELRHSEVEARHQSHVNLNMSNDKFFDKSDKLVKRYFIHDDLHRVTCYYEQPLFETLKVEKDKAKIEKSLFDELAFDDKMRVVREEGYAIALERKIIPAIEAGEDFDEKAAFDYALSRICTTLTKGWFREFALENYPQIREYDRDYVKLFLSAVENRRIDKCLTN